MDPNKQSQVPETPVTAPEAPTPALTPFEHAPAPAAQPMAASVAVDPGRGLGIASLILSLVGAGLVGLILGIIARNKSKAVGIKNGLALAGIIIGILNMIVVTLVIAIVAYAGISVAAECSKLGNGTHVLSNGTKLTCGPSSTN